MKRRSGSLSTREKIEEKKLLLYNGHFSKITAGDTSMSNPEGSPLCPGPPVYRPDLIQRCGHMHLRRLLAVQLQLHFCWRKSS